MKLSRGTAKIIAAILICSAITSVVVAAVLQTRIVEQSGFVQGSWDFNLFTDSDYTTPWTSEDWGTVLRGTQHTITRYLKNLGDDPIYVKWNCSDPPVGIYYTLEHEFGGPLTPWDENTYIGPIPTEPDTEHRFPFKVTLHITDAAATGTFASDITFYGSDSGA